MRGSGSTGIDGGDLAALRAAAARERAESCDGKAERYRKLAGAAKTAVEKLRCTELSNYWTKRAGEYRADAGPDPEHDDIAAGARKRERLEDQYAKLAADKWRERVRLEDEFDPTDGERK